MTPDTNTNPAKAGGREATMATTFAVTVSAADEAQAATKVARRLPQGFALTGRTGVRSARHGLFVAEVAHQGGDRNDCWVVLTSYGMSPSADLGSVWESVPGVGR